MDGWWMAECEWAREGCCIGWVCLCDETGRPHGLTGPFEVSPPLSRRVTVVETLDATLDCDTLSASCCSCRLPVPDPLAVLASRVTCEWKVMVSQARQYFVNYSS